MHILLLEPDSLLAASLSRYLSDAGHTVAWHTHPQDAVTSADKQTPQAVITEFQLAGRSGVEFLYEFRSYPDWQDMQVIVLSSLPPEQISNFQATLAELNISNYFYKPAATLSQIELALSPRLQPAAK